MWNALFFGFIIKNKLSCWTATAVSLKVCGQPAHKYSIFAVVFNETLGKYRPWCWLEEILETAKDPAGLLNVWGLLTYSCIKERNTYLFLLLIVVYLFCMVCPLQVMYLFLHTVKGTPFETPDQGKARLLTHWEQMDYGVQFTSSRKFLTISPIVL